jgi:hypothetical protein
MLNEMKSKKNRVNWSKGDAKVKLEAAVLKWNENSGKASMQAVADSEGVPISTFRRYALGIQELGAHAGRRKNDAEMRKKVTVSTMKEDEANMRVLAKMANPKAAVHGERIRRLESKMVNVTASTVGPSGIKMCVNYPSNRFVVKHAIRSPLSQSVAEWKILGMELSAEELKSLKKVRRNKKLRETRLRNKILFNLTTRGTVAKIVPPEASQVSGAIKFDSEASCTSPDYRLAFLPVVSLGTMQPGHLRRLQSVQERVVAALPNFAKPHRDGGNAGFSVGLTAVNGGVYGNRKKGVKGSIHLNPHLKQQPELQKAVLSVVEDILRSTYGKRPWFVELVRRLNGGDIPESSFLLGLPVSHIWLTNSPKLCNVHCDTTSLGAAFVFTAETVAGAELVIDKPVGNGYQATTYHLTAGRVIGGSWAQYAHCNLPLLDNVTPRRSWVVYLDYRAISADWRNFVPVPDSV